MQTSTIINQSNYILSFVDMPSKGLFSPFKAIGYVTDGKPFVVNAMNSENFIYTIIGKSFQIFRFDKLRVCLVSSPAPGNISSLQVHDDLAYASVDNDIYIYKRKDIVNKINIHDSKILGLLLIGFVLISYDVNNHLKIYDLKNRDLLGDIILLQSSTISSICHPATYINKVIIGYDNGELELWNINKQSIIYTFKSNKQYFINKNVSNIPRISCIEHSPACDVVGVGYHNGTIQLLNMKLDIVLFSFQQDNQCIVTSLSFRTDIGAEKFPYMVSGSSDGRVHIWNLGKVSTSDDDTNQNSAEVKPEKLIHQLENTINNGHIGYISNVHFLYGEPILITNSIDNSLKVWIFDMPNSNLPRLLRSREGHQGPSLKLRYYGGITAVSMRHMNDGSNSCLLSAGSDNTFRYFNTQIEHRNREISQVNILKKLGIYTRNGRLPTITGFDFIETRQNDWANIVTIHQNHKNAYLWKFKDLTISDIIISPYNKTDSSNVNNHLTAVAVSTCGNFCVLGSNTGDIFLYNIQSGLLRGQFPYNINIFDKDELLLYKSKAKQPGHVLNETINILNDSTNNSDIINPFIKDIALSNYNKLKENIDNKFTKHLVSITGLFIDITNTILVSCSLDNQIIFYDFLSCKIINTVTLDSNVQSLFLVGYKDGGYVAICGSDRVIRVYDMFTQKLIRRFSNGHSREITDICFSVNGKRVLTSSLDCTIRVYDTSTGRCISWLLFDSAVLSMAISLSGEYLCISQVDRDGIGMYVDRSLYETFHISKEPTNPIIVDSSNVHVDDNTKIFHDEESEEIDIDSDIEDNKSVSSNDSIIDNSKLKHKETTNQRAAGLITMSAIPKAYWTTLFHLEEIKFRNKLKEYDAEPKQTPFFLPTLVRDGVTPSFPTPEEYSKMVPKNESNKKVDNDDNNDNFKVDDLKSAWNDEPDNDNTWDDINVVSEDEDNETKHFSSKIIKGRSSLPRCQLVAHILTEYPNCLSNDYSTSYPHKDSGLDRPILSYLKSIPPSKIDIEMRSLCQHDNDDEGLAYLLAVIHMFIYSFQIGTNFEVLQAYLHRFLFIYNDTIIKLSQFEKPINELTIIQGSGCNKFRKLIHQNLCLLKVLARIPNF